MIAPSLDCSRATVCPHGSVRASWSSVKPFSFNSSAATWTVVSVRDLELDARLRHRPLHWPVRRAEARLRSLSQRPDPEGLATVDVFTVQVAVTFCGQRQAKRVHVQPSADARVRGDDCDAGDELHIQAASALPARPRGCPAAVASRDCAELGRGSAPISPDEGVKLRARCRTPVAVTSRRLLRYRRPSRGVG